MGAFTDLKAELIDFGAMQSYLDEIKDDPDINKADIRDILREESQAQLLLDLQVALNRQPKDTEDMAFIDTVVTAQEPRLRRALAVKQIELVCELKNQGEGSRVFDYWKAYRAEYETIRRGFPGLYKRQGSVRVRSVGNHR